MGFLLPRQEPSPSISAPGTTQNGPVGTGPLDYCARRLAGFETGAIPNIGPGSAAAIWSLVAFSAVFIALRIYCKIWRSRGIWWDDLVLILSWVWMPPTFPFPLPSSVSAYPFSILPTKLPPSASPQKANHPPKNTRPCSSPQQPSANG
jgi:hypothetical protein